MKQNPEVAAQHFREATHSTYVSLYTNFTNEPGNEGNNQLLGQIHEILEKICTKDDDAVLLLYPDPWKTISMSAKPYTADNIFE